MSFEKPRIAIPVPTSSDLAYNRRSWRQYAGAVLDAGGQPIEVALGLSRADLRRRMESCEGICLPGSPADVDPQRYGAERDPATAPADPAREETDFCLLDLAAADAKAVLGICYGLQSLNVWSGGALVQDLHALPVNHAAGAGVAIAHASIVSADSQFASLLDAREAPLVDGFRRLPVNSSHHQAVASPGDGLRIVARCPDDGVIEALEMEAEARSHGSCPGWMLGVQWHPERSTAISSASVAVFRSLIGHAGRTVVGDAEEASRLAVPTGQ